MSVRKIILATLAAAAVLAAVPASAQIYLGAGPGGAGVQVGPLGFGIGPRYGYRNYDRTAITMIVVMLTGARSCGNAT
jgi:hypothetical protein